MQERAAADPPYPAMNDRACGGFNSGHPHGDVELPLEIVMHQDDATAMAASILGRVHALWWFVAGAPEVGAFSFPARLNASAHGGPRARPRASGPQA